MRRQPRAHVRTTAELDKGSRTASWEAMCGWNLKVSEAPPKEKALQALVPWS